MSSDSSSSDESSEDESPPRTAAPPRRVRSVAHGTYGEVLRELNGGGADIVWEGGDTSTLDADAYEAALKSYARSPRAQGANDATSSSSDDDDDDDDADSDRPLEVGDKLLSPCGLVGTVEEISKAGVATVQWETLQGPARPVKSSRRAAQKAVSYAIATDVDEPKQLSMDDALRFRKLSVSYTHLTLPTTPYV